LPLLRYQFATPGAAAVSLAHRRRARIVAMIAVFAKEIA
jgi:hypothetical protein